MPFKPLLFARIKRANPLPRQAIKIIQPEKLIDPVYDGPPPPQEESSAEKPKKYVSDPCSVY